MVCLQKIAFVALGACFVSVEAISLVSGIQEIAKEVLQDFGIEPQQPGGDEVIFAFPPDDGDKPVPGNAPIVVCEAKEPQILDLQKVIIDPNPPVKGENLTFVAQGYLSKTVKEGAYAEVDVRYGFIRLIHQTFDLCEEIGKVGLLCPIEKGDQVIEKTVQIPYEVPPGKYIVNVKAYTKHDELITCLTATVDFPPN